MARVKVDTSSPHDGLFKGTFKVPTRAGALFRTSLPESVTAEIEWDTLERIPGSFINPRLANYYTDLLFSARVGDSELLLYLLLEHQSTAVHDMPFRMLTYMVEVWKAYCQHNPEAKRLPVIIPVLISHARNGWNQPLTLSEMLDPDPIMIPGLAPLMPRFDIIIHDDLSHLSNDELMARALDAISRLALVLLRDARDEEARVANRDLWLRLIRDVFRAPTGHEAMITFLSYLAHVFEREPFQEFCDTMQQAIPEANTTMETYAEYAEAKGLEKGLEKGLRMAIVDMLEVRGFSLTSEQRARVESCDSLETIQRWYAAAKTAPIDRPVDELLA